MIKLARFAAQVLVIDAAAFLVIGLPLWPVAERVSSSYDPWQETATAIIVMIIVPGFFALATLVILGAVLLVKYINTLGD